MRYLMVLLLAATFCLPTFAGTSPSVSQNKAGGTKWALFSGKHSKKVKKAKKAPKAKRNKKGAKRQHRAKRGR